MHEHQCRIAHYVSNRLCFPSGFPLRIPSFELPLECTCVVDVFEPNGICTTADFGGGGVHAEWIIDSHVSLAKDPDQRDGGHPASGAVCIVCWVRIYEPRLIGFRTGQWASFRRSAPPLSSFRRRKIKAQFLAFRRKSSATFSYKTSFNYRPNAGATMGYSTSCSFVGGGIMSHAVRRTSGVTWETTSTTGPHSLPYRRGRTCSSICTISMTNTVRPPTIV